MTDRDDDLQQRLLALFVDELDDHLATLEGGLVELERTVDTEARAELLRELFRAAHSVKGAAHAVSLPAVIQVADHLEATFSGLRDGSLELAPEVLSTLFAGVDALAELSHELSAESPAATRATEPAAAAVELADRPAAPTLRVASWKLDDLMRHAEALSGITARVDDLTAAVERAGDRRRGAARGPAATDTWLGRAAADAPTLRRDVRRVADDVAVTAQALRLQPFADATHGFERAVRDLAHDAGTEVGLVVEGGEVELDRDIVSALRDPLLHLVRNAVAHGIEPPHERTGAAKPAQGTLTVSAGATGGRIEVRVEDDGRGLDPHALRQAAERAGLQPVAAEDEVDMAFLPGVSTSAGVTTGAGRGVGLDAVRTTIERLGGSVRLESEPGRGTTVTLVAPLTRSTLRLLLVEIASQIVGVPAAHVHRLAVVASDDLHRLDDATVAVIDGRTVPVISLAAALGFVTGPPASGGAVHLVVVGVDTADAALLVDAFVDEAEVLTAALPRRLAGIVQLIGTTTGADGRVVLVVNVPACLRQGPGAAVAPSDDVAPDRPVTVLLVEDTVTTRALERSILEGAGYRVVVAADGMEAWELLDAHDTVDVVVSDVDMPRMDGIALCRAIRSSPRFRDLPILLVTSLESDADRERGLQAGASAYVVKSAFDQRKLLETIEQVR